MAPVDIMDVDNTEIMQQNINDDENREEVKSCVLYALYDKYPDIDESTLDEMVNQIYDEFDKIRIEYYDDNNGIHYTLTYDDINEISEKIYDKLPNIYMNMIYSIVDLIYYAENLTMKNE